MLPSQKALRLAARDDATEWVGLYRIYEVIEADLGGEHATAAPGMFPALKRFKHTCQSVAVAGDDARHGVERERPPRNPVTLDEARAGVAALMERWIGRLLGEPGTP